MGVRIASTAASLGLVLFSPAPARPSLASFLDVLATASQEEAPANELIESGTQTNGETSVASLAASPQDDTTLPSATDDESSEVTAKFPAVNGPPSSAVQRSSGQVNGGQATSTSFGAVSGDSLGAAPNWPGVSTHTAIPVSSSSALPSAQGGTAGNSDQKEIGNLQALEISAFAQVNPSATLNSGTVATSLAQNLQQDGSPVSVPGKRDASGSATAAPVAQEKTVTAQKAGGYANGRGMECESPAVVTGARPQAASAANLHTFSAPVGSALPAQLFKQAGSSGKSFQLVSAGASKQEVSRDSGTTPGAKTNSEPIAVARMASLQGDTALSSGALGESITGAAVALPINQYSIATQVKPSAPQTVRLVGGVSSTVANGEQQRASHVATDSGSSSQTVATVSSSRPLAWSASTVDASAGTAVGVPKTEISAIGLMQSSARTSSDGAKVLASQQTGATSLPEQIPVQGTASGSANQRTITSAPQKEVPQSSFAAAEATRFEGEKSALIDAAQATSGDTSQLPIQNAEPVETPRQMMPAARQDEAPKSTSIAEATTASKLASMLQSAALAASGSVSQPAMQAGSPIRSFQQVASDAWETAAPENVLTAISVKTSGIAASVPASSPATVPISTPLWQPQASTTSRTSQRTLGSATDEAVSDNTPMQAQFELSAPGNAATQQKASPSPSVAGIGSAHGVADYSPAEKISFSVQGPSVQQGSAQIEDGSIGVAEVEVSRAAAETENVQTAMPATASVVSARSDSKTSGSSEMAEPMPASAAEQTPVSRPEATPVNTPAATLASVPEQVQVSTVEAQVFGKSLANADLHGLSNEPTAQNPDRGAIADSTLNPPVEAASVAGAFSRALGSAPVEETSSRDAVVPGAEARITNGSSDRQQPAMGSSEAENDGFHDADAGSPGDHGETLTGQDQNGQDNQLRTNVGPSASKAGNVSVDAIPATRDTPAGFISLQVAPDTAKPEQAALATKPLNQTSPANAAVAAQPASVVAQPLTPTAEPVAVGDKPATIADPLPTASDKVTTVAAQPAAVVAQPTVPAAESAEVVDQPTLVADQSSAFIVGAAADVAQSAFVVDKRPAVVPQPAAVVAPPAAVVAQPAAVADKPSAVVDQAAVDVAKFAVVADEPPAVVDPPAVVAAQPAAAADKSNAVAIWPAAFAVQPALEAVQPSVVGAQPSNVADELPAVAPQAVAVADKPASFGAQPLAAATKSVGAVPQPAVAGKSASAAAPPAAVADKAAASGDSGAKLDSQLGNAAPFAEGIFALPATLPISAAHSISENANQPVSDSVQKATPGASNSRNPVVANTGNAVTGKPSDGASGAGAVQHNAQSSAQSSQATQADPSHTADVAARTADNAAPQTQSLAQAQALTQAQAQTIPVPAAAAAATAQRGPDVPETTAGPGEQQGVPAPTHPDGSEAVATSGVNTAKLMQAMGESEMRVGMRSSEFGDISIRTTITPEQMVTRISLDHSDLSQAISAHVSTMQTKLGEDFGLNASIEVHNMGSQLSGEQDQSSQREQGALNSSAQSGRVQVAPEEEAGMIPAALANAGNGNRLDIRA